MGSISFSPFSPKLFKNPTAAAASTKSNLGFKNLMESFTVDIHRAEGRQLNVPLIAPFTIATSRFEGVENVAIRVELNNGCVGCGEAPILPFVTAEDQITALKKAGEACEFLKKSQAMSLGDVLREIGQLLPGHDFAYEKMAHFRIRELKDILTQLGLSKQGKKQDLTDRIVAVLSDERVSGIWSKKNAVGKEEVAKLVDDIYR